MVKRSGFTLIEMMIVLAIIAALAATLTPIGISALNQARANRVLSDLRALNMAAVSRYTMAGSLTKQSGVDFPQFGNILSPGGLEFASSYSYSITDNVLTVTINPAGAAVKIPTKVIDGLKDLVEEEGDSFSLADFESSPITYTIWPMGR